jgi:RNA recognition motif-containing protein
LSLSPSSSSSTTITLTGLPQNAVKADIRPVFQRFGEVAHIYLQRDGKHANVVFTDVHGVKRALHAYAERPLRVRGHEVVVFRKSLTVDDGVVSGVDTDTQSQEPRRNGGVIFVSNFHHAMTQEDLLEALEPFGNYEKFMMSMSFFALLSPSLWQEGFSEWTCYHRSRV